MYISLKKFNKEYKIKIVLAITQWIWSIDLSIQRLTINTNIDWGDEQT